MSTVDVQIVTWNSLEVLPICLASVAAQDYPSIRVTIIDNASQDATLEFVEQHYPDITIIRNERNMGFSQAHNQAIRQSDAEFILVLNPDVWLEPDYLSQALAAAHDAAVGTVAGRILAISKEDFLAGSLPAECRIDCAGLEMLRNRRLVLRGHNQPDGPAFDVPADVFGSDGAVPFYRRTMLEDTRIGDEYFDEDFFSYKEDHDLAWRAQLFGWTTRYAPGARAYHIRTARPGQRSTMSGDVRLVGVRNRYTMMLKNEIGWLMLRDLWPILQYEAKILGYILLLERRSLRGYAQAYQLAAIMRRKRKAIMQHRRISISALRRWFT